MILLDNDKPRPQPLCFDVTPGLKIFLISFLSIPSPLSLIFIITLELDSLTEIIILPLSTFALSQFKINEIIVSGNNEISSKTIIAISGLSKTNNLSANAVNEGFRRLSDSGLFQNIVLNPVGSRLIISVIENPIINKVDFEGNKIFKDNFLLSIISSKSRTPFSKGIINEDHELFFGVAGQYSRESANNILSNSDLLVSIFFEV